MKETIEQSQAGKKEKRRWLRLFNNWGSPYWRARNIVDYSSNKSDYFTRGE